jgi:nitric oxide synthase oxygenase domain/subunit
MMFGLEQAHWNVDVARWAGYDEMSLGDPPGAEFDAIASPSLLRRAYDSTGFAPPISKSHARSPTGNPYP